MLLNLVGPVLIRFGVIRPDLESFGSLQIGFESPPLSIVDLSVFYRRSG